MLRSSVGLSSSSRPVQAGEVLELAPEAALDLYASGRGEAVDPAAFKRAVAEVTARAVAAERRGGAWPFLR